MKKKEKKNLRCCRIFFFYVLWCASYSLSGFEVKNLMIILVTLLSLPFPPPPPSRTEENNLLSVKKKMKRGYGLDV